MHLVFSIVNLFMNMCVAVIEYFYENHKKLLTESTYNKPRQDVILEASVVQLAAQLNSHDLQTAAPTNCEPLTMPALVVALSNASTFVYD